MSSRPLSEIFGWGGQPRLQSNNWKITSNAFPDVHKAAKELYKSDAVIGIEIEAENFRATNPDMDGYIPYLWARDADGSLRNAGVEFISVPLQGEWICFALNYLKTYLKGQEAQGFKPVVFSDLCGVHVHLNIRDFSVEQFVNLLFLYIAFENSLMRLAGDRSRNIFCLPINVLTPALRQLLSCDLSVANRAVENLVMGTNEGQSKYAALNYVPVARLGTVEFRHMEGNLDVPRLLNWISLILLLRDYAKASAYDELKESVLLLNTNSEYEQFAKRVFKDWYKVIDNSTLWKDVAAGVKKLKVLTIPARDIYVADVNEPARPHEKPPKLKMPDPEEIHLRIRAEAPRREAPPPPHVQAAIDRIKQRQERAERPQMVFDPLMFNDVKWGNVVIQGNNAQFVVVDNVVREEQRVMPAPPPEPKPEV